MFIAILNSHSKAGENPDVIERGVTRSSIKYGDSSEHFQTDSPGSHNSEIPAMDRGSRYPKLVCPTSSSDGVYWPL